MGYQVKWVEEHLGVTRRAICVMEKKQILPENKDGKYRDFSDEDIEKIWNVKILQGIGYSLDEIFEILNTENFDFHESITQKVSELEEKVEYLNEMIGYARYIKYKGKVPFGPEYIGRIKVGSFNDIIRKACNINDSSFDKNMQKIVELTKEGRERMISEKEAVELYDACKELLGIMKNWREPLSESVIPPALISRKDKGARNPEVQLLVKIMYESLVEIPELNDLTVDEFARMTAEKYQIGDNGEMNRLNLGEDVCNFMADAFAVFAGYSSYKDMAS